MITRGMSAREIFAVFAVIIFIASMFMIVPVHSFFPPSGMKTGISVSSELPSSGSGFLPLQYSRTEKSLPPIGIYNGNSTVMLTFHLRDQAGLRKYLAGISNPGSGMYHKYISRSRFASLYSQNVSFYYRAVAYLSSFGVRTHTYSDRVSILLSGEAAKMDSIFHTVIDTYINGSRSFYAPSSAPELPAWLSGSVAAVTGLSNLSSISPLFTPEKIIRSQSPSVKSTEGYPAPVTGNNSSYIWGSDMQVAYNERPLFNFTYASGEVIATILWTGFNYTNREFTAPYDPADVRKYFNYTLPANEPRPQVHGVPLGGIPAPGGSAQNDSTGAVLENTLDLEMAGSTAPGASIYNVYGISFLAAYIDSALAFILNPNSSYSALNRVTVISNSWGGTDTNNSVWYTYLMEAQARGITVLASSGDSGNNPVSIKYDSGDAVSFPSSMGYNSFGVTAVGGTTVTLMRNLELKSQAVWNVSKNYGSNGPFGSTGGISSIYSEPLWQSESSAQPVISAVGSGRATADISALANNTIVFITIGGNSYYADPGIFTLSGTSVSTPLVAGMIAEMDAVLGLHGVEPLGYLNPLLYRLGTLQQSHTFNLTAENHSSNDKNASILPLLPFSDVTHGRNYLYSALTGWDFPTGWGSLNAYNLTQYALGYNSTGNSFSVSGIRNIFNATSLTVSSYFATGVDSRVNATLQQNFYVADALGAPIYWIQNKIILKGSDSTGWYLNYSGLVEYLQSGGGNNLEWNYSCSPASRITVPYSFKMQSRLMNTSSLLDQAVIVTANGNSINMPVPGAAYIIGASNYSYFYNGNEYTNGILDNSTVPGTLSPQFSATGDSGGSIAVFRQPTHASLFSYLSPTGSGKYIQAQTSSFGIGADQSSDISVNLSWQRSPSHWNLSVSSGSSMQGVLSYLSGYSMKFNESGLPNGSLWYVNLSPAESISTDSHSMAFQPMNGSYTFSVSTSDKKFRPVNSTGTFVISGSGSNETVEFTKVLFNITIGESGLPAGTKWFVNITGMNGSFSADQNQSFELQNGTYSFRTYSQGRIYSPAYRRNFTVDGRAMNLVINFSRVLYGVIFKETGLPSGTSWSVSFEGMEKTTGGQTAEFNASNGSYTFNVSNSGPYYPPEYSGTLKVRGKQAVQIINFTMSAYITGTVDPSGSFLYVNGMLVLTNNGNFNVSVKEGSYLVTIHDQGYRTIYRNYSLHPGQVVVLNAVLTPLHNNAFIFLGLNSFEWLVIAGFATVAILIYRKIMKRR